MSQINRSSKRTLNKNWSFLLPIVLLAPMSMAAKGCDAVVGDDCPEGTVCAAGAPNNGSAGSPGAGASTVAGAPGTAGSSNTAGTSSGNAGASGVGNPLGGDCGGLLGLLCEKPLYCEYELEASCGSADQTGTCQKKPDACNDIYAPVCGCDGKTYPNACEAAAVGVSVSKNGACAGSDPVKACGGLKGVACDEGYYCDYPLAATCGAGDQSGTCAPIPQACDAVYSPVCGCDGKTYGNACAAALASIAVAKQGTCPTGKSCGGLIGAACDAGEFCDYPLEMACGNADGTGTCEAIPQTCTKEIAEVCGCDGKTYSNACLANSAGTSIYKTGKCPTK